MKIKQFIEKAIEGGWGKQYSPEVLSPSEDIVMVGIVKDGVRTTLSDRDVFLDPKAWEAVGKVEWWSYCKFHSFMGTQQESEDCNDCLHSDMIYSDKMHSMIDALCAGKSIVDFLAEL